MSLFEQPTWTRPESTASERPDAPSKRGTGGAARFLLAHGVEGRGDSRRIAAGLFGLAVLSLALTNVGVYSSARDHLVRQRWNQLVENTDDKREQVRDLVWQFEHQARYVADQPAMRRWAQEAVDGVLPRADARGVQAELDRATRTFRFHAIHLYSPDGRPLVVSLGEGVTRSNGDAALVSAALASDHPVFGRVRPEADGTRVMTLAMAIRDPAGRQPVAALAFQSSIDDVLLPVLMSWPGFGPTAGAYLVERDGDGVRFLTPPPPRYQVEAGDTRPIGSPDAHSAVMAAEGVESATEFKDSARRMVWGVTRYLPELDWGLVGQVDRSEMMQSMHGTLFGLLVLDFGMIVMAIGAFWFWRRQYHHGLARRELEVTQRHATRVQAIFDTAFDAILTFDGGGRVRTVNRAAETLLGRPAREIEGQPLQRFLRWSPTGRAPLTATPGSGSVNASEAMRADGTVIPVEFSLGSAGQDEELVHTAIVRDVSDRVEAERQIHAFAEGLEASNRRLEEVNAQLEEASRLKSEFLANTSHELRTPLNGMIGFLQLVLDGMCDTPEEERDFTKQALQCSRHLLGLINDVLDIAKIEAGKLALEVDRVDVQQLFDDVYTVTHVQAAQKGIRLEFEPMPDPSVHARGDFNKTKQVLINIVGNSLKFTPSGKITVRAIPQPELGHVMFEVVDTGIGIPADRQKLIFEKFTQGDGSTTRKYGGTGLGLAITRSLVELMGGIIGVQSRGEGSGTRMYFSLPTWRNEDPQANVPEEEASDRIEGPAGGALVLVVEDDTVFRRYVASLLHSNGYRTVEARHAEMGWVLTRRLRPSVVVLDYALTCSEGASLRTGWDLAERMTSDPETRHIPLIFVTGFDDELREKLRTTAFARRPEHLVKPVDGDALLAKIEELVGETHGRQVRVLMADDDPSVAAYVRKVLPQERYHLEVTTNGGECLHFLRTQPRGFDLLLLDLMMPDVSGYDVLREMTLTGLAADLPVLVLTNFPEARNEEERRLLEQGLVLDVLPKMSVHDNPQLLPHIIDWHLQVISEGDGGSDAKEAA